MISLRTCTSVSTFNKITEFYSKKTCSRQSDPPPSFSKQSDSPGGGTQLGRCSRRWKPTRRVVTSTCVLTTCVAELSVAMLLSHNSLRKQQSLHSKSRVPRSFSLYLLLLLEAEMTALVAFLTLTRSIASVFF